MDSCDHRKGLRQSEQKAGADMMTLSEYHRQRQAWMTLHGCEGCRCPLGCAEPRPLFAEGLMWCSACLERGVQTEVEPDEAERRGDD